MRTSRKIAACSALAAGVVVAAGPAMAFPIPEVAPKGSCKLVTVSEAGTILATPVGAGQQTTRTAQGITGDRCVWAAKKKGTGGLKGQPLQLEIVVESGATLVNDYNTAKSADPTKTDAVAGLGDDAFIEDLKLHVLVSDRVLSTGLHNTGTRSR